MLKPSYHSAHNPNAAKTPSLQEEPVHGLPTGILGIGACAPHQGSSARDKEYHPTPKTPVNAAKVVGSLGHAGIKHNNVFKNSIYLFQAKGRRMY